MTMSHGATPSAGRMWTIIEAIEAYLSLNAELALVDLKAVHAGDFPVNVQYPTISITPTEEEPGQQPGTCFDDFQYYIEVRCREAEADNTTNVQNVLWMAEVVKEVARTNPQWGTNAMHTSIASVVYGWNLEDGSYRNEATVTLLVKVGEAYPSEAGDAGNQGENGVVWTFNQPYIQGPASTTQNDHSLKFVNGRWHSIGISGPGETNGSEYFAHYSSPDLRSWGSRTLIQLGTGNQGDWNHNVWACYIIDNPNYGIGGAPQTTYKYLMFFTGVTHTSPTATREQKIGLAGCLSDADYENDIWTTLNSEQPIYWANMDDTGNGGAYAGGAPWGTYSDPANWDGDSRDAYVVEDGGTWNLFLCARSSNAGKMTLGHATVTESGGYPDFTSLIHSATTISDNDLTNFGAEASTLFKIDDEWHLMWGANSGTRHQSQSSMKGSWSENQYHGPLLGSPTPHGAGTGETGSASEVVQISGTQYVLSQHKDKTSNLGYFYYKYSECDFSDLTSGTYGNYPAETNWGNMEGCVAVSGGLSVASGTMDQSLVWSGVYNQEAATGAFYYQPIWGDAYMAASGTSSNMTGNSYIATAFKHYRPGLTQSTISSGEMWPDMSRYGIIESSPWVLTKNRISISVGGTNNYATQYVGLLLNDTSEMVASATGNDSHVVEEVVWDVSALVGTEVKLWIVDFGGGHIAVDQIREYQGSDEGSQPKAAGKGVNALGLIPT
jgi:hypothetical protein